MSLSKDRFQDLEKCELDESGRLKRTETLVYDVLDSFFEANPDEAYTITDLKTELEDCLAAYPGLSMDNYRSRNFVNRLDDLVKERKIEARKDSMGKVYFKLKESEKN